MCGIKNNKAILKMAGIAVFAAMFCIGCGDSDSAINANGTDTTYYVIKFDPTGGTVTPDSGVVMMIGDASYRPEVVRYMPTPIKEGYVFMGWFTAAVGGEEVSGNQLGRGGLLYRKNATVYAHWTLAHYRVSFDAHGGEVSPAYGTTGDGWKLASLPEPTRENHTFDGWYKDVVGVREKVTESTVFKSDAVIYAHWIYTGVHYTITFDANGGTVDPATAETDVGGKLEELTVDATRDGYDFVGWFTEKTGGVEVTTNSVFIADATVYARWVFITPEMFIVTFNAHGGKVSPASRATGEDGKLASLPTPTREGFAFRGWFTEEDSVTASTVFHADAIIHATWNIIHYTITFDAMGGVVTPTSALTRSHWELGVLPAPTKGGYDFAGWYTAEDGGTLVTMTTPLIGDATIYARYEENGERYTVTFETAGGSAMEPQSVVRNGLVAEPTALVRAGYVFDGWYKEDARWSAWDFGTDVVTSDTTLWAKWNKIPSGGTTFIDSRDGRTYKKVVIGVQTWMAENLNYDVPNDTGDGCWHNDEKECEKYGRLYDWPTLMGGAPSSTANPSGVQGACPVGWHVPSDAEWSVLVGFAGDFAGTKLMSATGWPKSPYNTHVGTDEYGFSAFPDHSGLPRAAGLDGYDYADVGSWWTATVGSPYNSNEKDGAFVRWMGVGYDSVLLSSGQKYSKLHVRCVED